MAETCCWGNAVNKKCDTSCPPRLREAYERISNLEDMLRLANDKMAEQVRQARYDTAFEIRTAMFPLDTALKIEEANAPKD